ncbi:hypothetical protein H8N03_10585 [Ramlibacter sp. USB13]|uniref:DUF3313 domain-containing protein n=1 Tax=Ramlibacter cellulosilyticus TaxID=2764187 RepID=A0A923MR53_9BURK|nr:hypothetical protein [Ramlibacter cellulosilyticus]MBC5783391.1 hypothetical protein [Ramlibacter cellulosilyticus]
MIRRFLLLAAVLLLAACANVQRMDGDQVVNEKLVVHVSDAWNKVSDPWDVDPYDTWTQEGIPLDHLRFWGGVRPGQPLMTRPALFSRAPDARQPRVPTFRPGLSAERLVSLFEELYANAGTVNVTRIEPAVFAGQKGVRFEFTLERRRDDLSMQGVGWVAVRPSAETGEELYAATFVAPKLSFYQRLLPLAEAVVKTARVREPAKKS